MDVKMDATMPTIPRPQWTANQAAEAEFWSEWLRAGATNADKAAAADLQLRTTDVCDVSDREMVAPYLRPACPPGSQVRILDVGAGPLTWCPRKWLSRDLAVTPIDPLAGEF